MSSKPRRQFLAPFILTCAAALPGCKHDSKPTIHDNPPEPHAYRTWSVWASGDGCEASDNASDACPPDATCNPPPPMAVACPDGMTDDATIVVVQDAEGGPCHLDGDLAEIACPDEMGEEEEMPEEPDDLTED